MPKLESQLRLSKQFILLQLMMLLGSLGTVYYLSWSGCIKILLIAMLLSYSMLIFYQQTRWQGIRHDVNGWWLQNASQEFNVTFTGDSTVTSHVMILRFSIPGRSGKQSCIIFKDAMLPKLYRQLIVRLRYFPTSRTANHSGAQPKNKLIFPALPNLET